ncbi:mobile element protein [Rhodococcus aetherivorans]|uniref:Mobile element protein n=1 Tax=Rhodococcus aetherivorans TaxID=191292 RepID=A0ABQ0YJU4_9NOCA|nr:transposase IS204/IS1001/IS1096/IS1165 family protein [Rhodococcus rhodochrous ATCC 21198]GES36797.1 mobile element protein [Rhodococcus aetherivorans]
MDPFHGVRVAGDALDKCRRRVQLAIHGHCGHKDDPLYAARRTLHTGADLLTDKQQDRLTALFAAEEHVEVEATWGIYQRMIAAYRHPDRTKGREPMRNLIGSVSAGVPAALSEVITLGRTLKKRAVDVLAYFDRPGTSNGPTEAISGRLEHLCGSALGFGNLTTYIAGSLLETGGFRPLLHPGLGRAALCPGSFTTMWARWSSQFGGIWLIVLPHRIYFRASAFEEQGHQGAGLADGRARAGVHGDRGR